MSNWLKLLLIFLISFILNLIWENAHSYLYTSYHGGPITELILLHATLVDALIITAMSVPFVFSLRYRRYSWLVIPIGIIIAIIIELIALKMGNWSYNSFMPIIPLLNVGLTPTIQLGILGYISMILVIKK